MPTHSTHCDWCGQHRQAEQDLREAMEALRKAISEADGWCDESRGYPCFEVDQERALLARLDERYGN